MKDIKNVLIVLVAISMVILIILFFQDNTKKLEDRSYKEIDRLIINSENSDISFYKSEDEKVRVIIKGSKKDKIELIEGTKSLTINQEPKNSICFFNCRKEIKIYIPDNFPEVAIKTNKGNVNSDKQTINNILINTKVGNVSLYKTNTVNITSNVGDIFVKEINATNNSTISTDVGNIKISKIINLNLDIKTDLGSKVIPVIKDDQEYTLKIETNVGNIDIDSHENKS